MWIVSAVIAAFCFFVACFNFANRQFLWGIVMILLTIMDVGIAIRSYNEDKTAEQQEFLVSPIGNKTTTGALINVVSYDIDSTTVINGVDTTKIYKINYVQTR